MAGKALRILLFTAPLLGGCALWEKGPSIESSPPKQVVPATKPATRKEVEPRAPRPTRSASSARTPAPTASPTANSSANENTAVIVTKPGASPAQPVPLFRQAIVLANVRASLAALPNPPQAEFRQGLLTLTFREAPGEQVTTAVNRAIAVPEVARIQVITAPR